EVKTVRCPKKLGPTFAKILSCTDLVSGQMHLDLVGLFADREQEFKPDALFQVRDLRLGGKQKVGGREALVLVYSAVHPDGSTLPATLWVDAQTHLPLKRVTVFTNGPGSSRTTETFTDVRIDEKVDPREFEIKK